MSAALSVLLLQKDRSLIADKSSMRGVNLIQKPPSVTSSFGVALFIYFKHNSHFKGRSSQFVSKKYDYFSWLSTVLSTVH
jgi:hypothetical protein